MFTRFTAAVLLTLTLAAPAAHADTPAYQMPGAFQTLVTGGASYDGSFTDEQFAAYCVTFGLIVNQSWDGVLPASFSDKAFNLLASLALSGQNVNQAAIAGSADAETFVHTSDPGSAEAQMIVQVLTMIIGE